MQPKNLPPKPSMPRRSGLSALIIWITIVALILILVFYIRRIARRNDEQGRYDLGTAILEFGRAFPEEAIRSLHGTKDGDVFVRLHNDKTGFMRNRRNHYACHLIQPGRVRIVPLADAKGFVAEFLDAPTLNGEFIFVKESEAAEVSLWLLDNYVSVTGKISDDGQPDGGREMAAADGDASTPDRAN
jgi:hypothetical protein